MPEDQGVNGDIWNDEASILFQKLGWTTVGDANIDVKTTEEDFRGLDRMLKYSDAVRHGSMQGFFLEAKRYKTTSYNKNKLEEWINVLNKKLHIIKNSEEFHSTYPGMEETILRQGVIVIWFSNIQEYVNYESTFREHLAKVKLPGKSSSNTLNKIFVLENREILRLSSVVDTVQKYNTLNRGELFFYYPSSSRLKNPADISKVLSIEYIYSKFILSQSIDESGKEYYVVFYFGTLNLDSFKRLQSALYSFGYIHKFKPLTIYTYQRDDEFRKVRPDVESLFAEVTFNLEEMELFSDLPTFLKKKN